MDVDALTKLMPQLDDRLLCLLVRGGQLGKPILPSGSLAPLHHRANNVAEWSMDEDNLNLPGVPQRQLDNLARPHNILELVVKDQINGIRAVRKQRRLPGAGASRRN